METPLPCPFCGSPAVVRTREGENLWDHNIVTWTYVGCPECDVGFNWPPDAEPDAMTQWNTRAPVIEAARKMGDE